MSVEIIDGFDHYNNPAYGKWDSVTTGLSQYAGRFGGFSAAFDAGGLRKVLSGNFATLTCGFAWRPGALNGSILASFLDGGTVGTLGTYQMELRCSNTGQLQVTRNGTVLATSTFAANVNNWYYVEFKVTIASSGGSYDVHVAGASVVSGTGNTQNTSNSYANQVYFNSDNGRSHQYDDLYVLNSSGSVNNTFLGECQIFTSLANGDDASYKQWTPSAGTNHYANINENPPDGDTTYNSSQTPGNIDMFTFPTISPGGAIICEQTTMAIRKDNTGARTVSEQCKSGATVFTGGNVFTPLSNYLMYMQVRENDPNTSAAWTVANLNAAEFGIKLVS